MVVYDSNSNLNKSDSCRIGSKTTNECIIPFKQTYIIYFRPENIK